MLIKLVVVGYHGVVVNSSNLIYQAICDLLFDHPLFGQRAIPSFPNLLQFFVPPGYDWCGAHGFDFPPGKLEKALRLALRNTPMFPETETFLCRIQREFRVPVVIISFDRKLIIEKQLEKKRLRRYVELVVGGSPDKTVAVSFLCSTFFNIKPENVVYIGGTPLGMRQSHDAGVISMGFSDDRPVMEKALANAGARYCARNHEELGDVLVELTRT